MYRQISTALKLTALTILFCCVIYPILVWVFAQVVVPDSANGHLVRNSSGVIVGSSQVAQKFSQNRYFHPRPSAVDYDAAGAGGSNLSPASEAFREKVVERIEANGATPGRPLPVDMATASGSGLDPHISLASALYQLPRVAKARGLPEEKVAKVVEESVTYPGNWIVREPIVNVLELNMRLDELK